MPLVESLLVLSSLILPLVLAAIVSLRRCVAQHDWQWMFLGGALSGSMVAALVFSAFAFYFWCFPSGGPSPSPVGMSEPSGATWAILTGIYTFIGAFIGLGTATAVLLGRQFQSLAKGRSQLP